jgi:hypothetical protein
MNGDERVRHCADCSLDVYNFSAMTERQIQRLLLATNGRLCARWYRRRDGTILTADCPVGFRARVRKISLVAGTALSALFSMSPAVGQTAGSASDSTSKIESSENGRGVIVVRVEDESGAMIQKAQVTVLNSLNKAIIQGKTDDVGEFRAVGLKSGSYSLQVLSSGFEESEIQGVLVEANKQNGKPVSVQMSVAVAVMGGPIESRDTPLPEGSGDSPILLPLASAPAAAPIQKPTTIRRLISKIKGNTN